MSRKSSKNKKSATGKKPSPVAPVKPPANRVATGKDPDNRGPHPNQAKPFWRSKGWWTAGVTLVLAVISGFQYWSSERSREVGERALQLNRAYVIPTDSVIRGTNKDGLRERQERIGPLKVGDRPSLEVTITNTGNTPATEIRSHVFVGTIREFPSDSTIGQYLKLPTTPPAKTQTILAKDDDLFLGAVHGTPLSTEDIRNIETYTTFLAVFGFTEYRDVFDRQRKTRFCHHYDPTSKRMVGCATYNHVD